MKYIQIITKFDKCCLLHGKNLYYKQYSGTVYKAVPSSSAKIHQEIFMFSYVVLQVIITICFKLLLDEKLLRTLSESAYNN